MPTRISVLAIVLAFVCSSVVLADEKPTIEDVNANPSRFVGQTVTFEMVYLYGIVTEGKGHFRFTVKSPNSTVYKGTAIESEQKIVFASRNKDENVTKFVKTLNAEHFYTVNMSVTIQKMGGKAGQDGKHFAIVKSIDTVVNSYQDK